MNRIGLVFRVIYTTIILICVVLSLSSGDYKGQFVLLQLPIALQAALIQELGFGSQLAQLSWVTAYVFLGLPIFALLDGAGWLMGGRWPEHFTAQLLIDVEGLCTCPTHVRRSPGNGRRWRRRVAGSWAVSTGVRCDSPPGHSTLGAQPTQIGGAVDRAVHQRLV